MNLFSNFCYLPSGVSFETQDEDEHVILFLRQHGIVMVPWIILAVFLFFLPALVFPIVLSLLSASVTVPAAYPLVATAFWYVAVFGFVLVKFIGWYFNLYIVTNERIVDIDFLNLLYKRFSQTELHRLQNITYSSRGIFAAFFNFGNVTVETAGETPNIECIAVPHPDKVVEVIRTLSAQTVQKEL